jgi:hypothetical protein
LLAPRFAGRAAFCEGSFLGDCSLIVCVGLGRRALGKIEPGRRGINTWSRGQRDYLSRRVSWFGISSAWDRDASRFARLRRFRPLSLDAFLRRMPFDRIRRMMHRVPSLMQSVRRDAARLVHSMMRRVTATCAEHERPSRKQRTKIPLHTSEKSYPVRNPAAHEGEEARHWAPRGFRLAISRTRWPFAF